MALRLMISRAFRLKHVTREAPIVAPQPDLLRASDLGSDPFFGNKSHIFWRTAQAGNRAFCCPSVQRRCLRENSVAYLFHNTPQKPRNVAKVVACMAGRIHRLSSHTGWRNSSLLRSSPAEFIYEAV